MTRIMDLRGLTVHTPPQISQKCSSTVTGTFCCVRDVYLENTEMEIWKKNETQKCIFGKHRNGNLEKNETQKCIFGKHRNGNLEEKK